MLAVLLAQFLSALADNALLFAAIALLKAQQAPAWMPPLLQECFVLAFILLAPFVGPFADAWPKGRVMMIANGCKLAGSAAMLAGLNPLLAYNLVGVGAAAYSPAKYGILSELVAPDALVKANSLMEGSTIVAILLGAVAGGLLADWSISGALAAVCATYCAAALTNLAIPALPAEHPLQRRALSALWQDFYAATLSLFRNNDARFSLLGTSLFWGTGSTLRFLLVAWVPVALLIDDTSTPANLSGVVAIGIAVGAAAAARWVTLTTAYRALPAGLLIGVWIMLLAHVTSLPLSAALLVLIGACGGFFVVPLNALLQERGHESVGGGHAIAVQNFCENLCMLLLIGLYTLLMRAGLSPVDSATGFGALVLLGMGWLAWLRYARTEFQISPNLVVALGRDVGFDAWLAWQGQAFRDVAGRRTLRFEAGGRGYFIKIHSGVGWREIGKNLLSGRLAVLGADNEHRAIARLQQLCVDTMQVAGFGSRGWNPARRQSFLITEELADTVSLEDLCRDWPTQPPNVSFKRALIARVADIAKTLHEHGVNHRDFYICHFLWHRADPRQVPRLSVIDLHRAQLRHRTPQRWLVKDLGALYFSAMDIGLTQRDLLRFLRRYRGRPLREVLKEEAGFWRVVRRRADRLYASWQPLKQ